MLLNRQDWDTPVVEKHHIWFAMNVVIVSILLRSFFVDIHSFDSGLLYLTAYILVLMFFIKILSLILFMFSFPIINQFKIYKTKNPLGVDDFNLSSASISTSFIVERLWNLMDVYLLILIIIPIFYITFWINKRINLPT